MPRPLRVCVSGGIYHVISRGNDQRLIFLNNRDRKVFLGYLREVIKKFEWNGLSYVLMGNHFHLVIQIGRANLSAGMHLLNGAYARYFNRKYGCSGHLFQGRFSSSLVDTDSYLANLLCYVVLNPVRAGLCRTADDWHWSAHHALVGTRVDELVNVENTLSYLDSDPEKGRQIYREMVNVRSSG